MLARLLPMICVLALLSITCVALAQDEKEEKSETPRFFFEKKGGLADRQVEDEGKAEPPAGDEEPMAAADERRPAAVAAAFDFETDAQLANWFAVDQEAVLDRATEAGVAHAGDGCLRMTYMPREGVFEQLSVGRLWQVRGRTLSFWIKTDFPTNLSFGVVETTGAFYQQFAAIPADEWTHVSVPLASLILAQDTPDASGRLEVPTIAELRFADLANLPGALGDALGRKAGVQRLLLDDIAITDDDAPPVGGEGAPALLADGFERETIQALAIGEAELRRTEGAEGQALEVLCRERAQRWMGFVMAVGQLDLADVETLSLRMTASQPLMVNVSLEEWDGSKYSQRLRIGPEGGWSEKRLTIGELLLEGDSDDESGRLDPNEIRVLVIVADMTRVEEFPVTFAVDEVVFE